MSFLSRIGLLAVTQGLKKWDELPWLDKLRQIGTRKMGGIGLKLEQFRFMRQSRELGDLQGLAFPFHRNLSERLPILNPQLVAVLDDLGAYGLQGSIAEVFRVRSRDHGWLAVKTRRTGIEKAIQQDSRILETSLHAFGHFKEGFQVGEYSRFFSSELEGELDLKRELKIQERLAAASSNQARYVIPEPLAALSNDSSLVMRWESSQPLLSARAQADPVKDELLGSLCEAFLNSFIGQGLLMADLNPGNVGWRQYHGRPQLVLYDFGSVLEVQSGIPFAFLNLVRAAREGSSPMEALRQLGFATDKMRDLEDRIDEYLRMLLEPFLAEKPYPLDQWQRKTRSQSILGDRRWTFMNSAPSQLFGFMRGLHGLFFWHDALNRPFHIWPRLERFLELSNATQDGFGMQMDQSSVTDGKTNLYVHIFKQEETLVKLTLPGNCAGRLEELVDAGIRRVLEEKKIDLRPISQAAIDSRFAPADLFHEMVDGKRIHIFLA